MQVANCCYSFPLTWSSKPRIGTVPVMNIQALNVLVVLIHKVLKLYSTVFLKCRICHQ